MRESIFKAFFIAACLATGAAHGWWDHPCITRAAWDALPRELTAQYTDFERDELCFHTMMSDYPRMKTAGDFGYFQLWDAFMWRQRRAIVGYENGGGKDIDFARLMQSAVGGASANAAVGTSGAFPVSRGSAYLTLTALSEGVDRKSVV